MDVLHQSRRGGLVPDDAGWALQRALLAHLEQVWRQPDEGIWEVRGPRQQFTHSKVMAWVAFDRAVRDAEEFGLDGPVDRWREYRATTFTTTSARKASTRSSTRSSRPMARAISTPACCSCRSWASCRPKIPACSARWRRSRRHLMAGRARLSVRLRGGAGRAAIRRGRLHRLLAAGWPMSTSCSVG